MPFTTTDLIFVTAENGKNDNDCKHGSTQFLRETPSYIPWTIQFAKFHAINYEITPRKTFHSNLPVSLIIQCSPNPKYRNARTVSQPAAVSVLVVLFVLPVAFSLLSLAVRILHVYGTWPPWRLQLARGHMFVGGSFLVCRLLLLCCSRHLQENRPFSIWNINNDSSARSYCCCYLNCFPHCYYFSRAALLSSTFSSFRNKKGFELPVVRAISFSSFWRSNSAGRSTVATLLPAKFDCCCWWWCCGYHRHRIGP